LDKCTRQLFKFPGSRRFTGSQPDHDVLDAHRLTRPKSKIPHDAVALVQQSDHRDPLRHWSHAGLLRRSPRYVDGDWLVAGRFALLGAVAPGR